MGDKLFPDSYFGPTEPVKHHLPVFSEGDGPSFKDFVDIINPLQHIPIVATIYRNLTGDRPGAVARVAGGALYGGPVGLVTELIDCAVDDNSGKDIGDTMLALVKGENVGSEGAADDTALANAETPKPPEALAAAAAPPAAEPPMPQAAPVAPVTVAASPVSTPPPAAMAAAAPPPPPAAAPRPPVTVAAAAPMALSQQDAAMRFRPLPARRTGDPAPMPSRVPLSTSGQRSNVPVTGYNPKMAANAAAMRMLADQAQQQQAAQGAPSGGPGKDWFSTSMIQALDKYQRNGAAHRPTETASPVP
jgi:hypothetical protein